jgi:hypothetical protein
MKKLIYLLFITLLLSSCGTKKNVVIANNKNIVSVKNVTFSGGDGSSFNKAIIIKAKNSTDGIAAEYKYVSKKYGRRGVDWKMIQQSLSYNKKKPYDILKINYKEKEINIYFDISSFFGKF